MKNDKTKLSSRQPVVVIMGHIDHGKSTLLDYIRKTNTTDKEAGGITQHVAAYEAAGITFLDTPGHAAFTSIRERGSKVADIAVLVVSAEDGVKPQTVEAIKWIQKANIPYLVAINKIDKPNANPEKAKTELADHDVIVEGWGGKIPCLLISAKTGAGIPELLETLLLQAEIDELTFDESDSASGFVIESKRDSKRGVCATLIIKEGVLKKGEFVRAGDALAPVRIVEDFSGKAIDTSKAGQPVTIVGWSEVPPVGVTFSTYASKVDAEKDRLEEAQIKKTVGHTGSMQQDSKKLLPIVIKSDTIGSLEAIIHESKKLETDKIGLKIIAQGVGPITEADAKLGKAFSDLAIIGFNVKTDPGAADMIIRDSMTAKTFSIIYELTQWLDTILKEKKPQRRSR